MSINQVILAFVIGSYLNGFVLESEPIESLNGFGSIVLIVIINEPVTQTLTCNWKAQNENRRMNRTLPLPVTLSRISLQLSTSPMEEKSDRISSWVMV